MDLEAAIAALWAESRPRLRVRLAVLESAYVTQIGGTLEPAARSAAVLEAHTLVGTLGTFGEREGSAAARVLEQALRGSAGADALAEPLAVLSRVLAD